MVGSGTDPAAVEEYFCGGAIEAGKRRKLADKFGGL